MLPFSRFKLPADLAFALGAPRRIMNGTYGRDDALLLTAAVLMVPVALVDGIAYKLATGIIPLLRGAWPDGGALALSGIALATVATGALALVCLIAAAVLSTIAAGMYVDDDLRMWLLYESEGLLLRRALVVAAMAAPILSAAVYVLPWLAGQG
jgi:hypothetical protein